MEDIRDEIALRYTELGKDWFSQCVGRGETLDSAQYNEQDVAEFLKRHGIDVSDIDTKDIIKCFEESMNDYADKVSESVFRQIFVRKQEYWDWYHETHDVHEVLKHNPTGKDIINYFMNDDVLDGIIIDVNNEITVPRSIIVSEIKNDSSMSMLVDYFKNNEKLRINDIKNSGFAIGDSFSLLDYVDVETRECPFVYMNGEILFGKTEQTHAQMLNDLLRKKGESEFEEKWYRPDLEDMETKFGETAYAFGSYYDDMAFISSETITDCTVEDICDALFSCKKKITEIYIMKDMECKRIAMSI